MIKQFLSKYKHVLILMTIGILAGVLTFIAVSHFNNAKEKARTPEIVTPASTTAADLKEYFPKESKSTLKDISSQIDKAHSNTLPEYKYYTYSQVVSDKIAQEYGKKQKADKIVKTTTEIPIMSNKNDNNVENKADSNAVNNNNTAKNKIIENSYYAINLERKHRIIIGGAHINDKNYATIAYRNRDIEYTTYFEPNKNAYGFGASVTIAKW